MSDSVVFYPEVEYLTFAHWLEKHSEHKTSWDKEIVYTVHRGQGEIEGTDGDRAAGGTGADQAA